MDEDKTTVRYRKTTCTPSVMAGIAKDPTAIPTAIAFATVSLLTCLLNLLSLALLAPHGNIGATTITALAMLANFMNFLNAVLWPNDAISEWYSGVSLCDIEVKLQPIISTAFPAALFCILRSLAKVLDAKCTTLVVSSAQKRRVFFTEIFICGILPLLQGVFAWVVQPLRFFVYGIAGCSAAVDESWMTPLLLSGPRLLWTIACVHFAAMFTHHNTTKSRFVRLYILCILCIVGLFPLELWLDYRSMTSGPLTSFDWQETHHPTNYQWNSIVYFPSHGWVPFDRYIWLAGGLVVFLTFGFGPDALRVYRRHLSKIGLGNRLLDSAFGRDGGSTTSDAGSTTRASLVSSEMKNRWSLKRMISRSTSVLSSQVTVCSPRSNSACEPVERIIEAEHIV